METKLRRGMTLVELLVIIGLICLAAVILMPAPHRTRYNARKSACQNNLKKLGLAVRQYLQDADEKYPVVFSGDTAYGWADALLPYYKDTQILQCPQDYSVTSSQANQPGYNDYWYNANFMVHDKNGQPTSAKAASLKSPAQTILLGDGGAEKGDNGHDATYNQCGDGRSLTAPGQICIRAMPGYAIYSSAQLHLDGANFAFADGHVKWLRGNYPTKSAQVLSNGMTKQSISSKTHKNKLTFSLLIK